MRNSQAYIMGAYEHPTRKADDKSLGQLHAEVAKGALEDAGLAKDDVDGYFCAGDAPGLGQLAPHNLRRFLPEGVVRRLHSVEVSLFCYTRFPKIALRHCCNEAFSGAQLNP